MTASDAATVDLLSAACFAVLGLLLGAVVSVLASVATRLLMRRHRHLRHVSRRLKLRQRVTFLSLGTLAGIWWAGRTQVAHGVVHWHAGFQHFFVVAGVLGCGWLLAGVLGAVEDVVLEGPRKGAPPPQLRRLQTQMQVVSRVGSVIIWLVALAIVLFTFPQMRIAGTSMFASAGVLSIVAGLAAQSTLSNLFAGLQLAFTDAIRVDDTVVVQLNGQSTGTTGRIEEITLTYVVVRVWDDRRVILPSTYFTTTAFENWSRRDPEMLGTVEFDLDWMVPVEAMRAEFRRRLSDMEQWDGRVATLQVTDATGSFTRIRALVSARNSGDLWDLRCRVREEMVVWLQDTAPFALPRVRMEPRPTTAPTAERREELTRRSLRLWEQKQTADEDLATMPTQVIDVIPLARDRGTAGGPGRGRRGPAEPR